MKRILLLAVLMISSAAYAQTNTAPEKNDTLSYFIGTNFGSFIKQNGFPVNKIDKKVVYEGIIDFLNSKGNPYDPDFSKQFRYDLDIMGDVLKRAIEEYRQEKGEANLAKQQQFLEENKMKEGVYTSESGLQYRILNPGNAVRPKSTDKVLVNYKGSLLDNRVFDENTETTFLLERVVKGFGEGLQLIGEGGKIILYIPSELAYGQQGNGYVEPNSLLIFEVELLKVVKE